MVKGGSGLDAITQRTLKLVRTSLIRCFKPTRHTENTLRITSDFMTYISAQVGESSIKDDLICTNIAEWLSQKDKSFSDPHFCQSSCLNYSRTIDGLDCVACENPDYYGCPSSDTCLHPSLVCDGHPQCQGGEDENLDQCLDKYIKNKVIQKIATLRCTSTFYENLQIFATPCDGIEECQDGKDEVGCNDNQITTIIVAVSMTTVFVMFIALRILKRNCHNLSQDNKKHNLNEAEMYAYTGSFILKVRK